MDRPGGHGGAGPQPADPCRRGSVDAALRGGRVLADRSRPARLGRPGRGAILPVAGRGDRPAVGALRRPDPGADPDRRGLAGRRRRLDRPVAGLCGRRRHLPGPGPTGRRAGVQGDEGRPGRRRMGAARPGGSGSGRGRRHRSGPGHRPADPDFGRRHGTARTGPADDGRPRRPDQHRPRRPEQPAGRGRHAAPVRRHDLDQLAAPDPRATARQGGGGRLLDLFLHQLPARPALCPRLGRKI